MTCEIPNVDIANQCNFILHLEKHVYFVGIINNYGRLTGFAQKPNKTMENLKKSDLEMLFIQTRLHTSMLDDHDKNFGRFGYCIVERERTTLLTIPAQYGTLLVIASNKTDSKKLAKQISQVAYRDCFAKILN